MFAKPQQTTRSLKVLFLCCPDCQTVCWDYIKQQKKESLLHLLLDSDLLTLQLQFVILIFMTAQCKCCMLPDVHLIKPLLPNTAAAADQVVPELYCKQTGGGMLFVYWQDTMNWFLNPTCFGKDANVIWTTFFSSVHFRISIFVTFS